MNYELKIMLLLQHNLPCLEPGREVYVRVRPTQGKRV